MVDIIYITHDYFQESTTAMESFPLTHLPLVQNGRHFADNIFQCIFVNEKFCISIKISLKFVPNPDSKVHGANMGPTWVLLAPDGPHVVPMNLPIRDVSNWQ